MATHYDSIGTNFDVFTTLAGSQVSYHDIEETVVPLIQRIHQTRPSCSVLDLACSTGRFTRALHAWGADYVLGIDLSKLMIDAAASDPSNPSTVKFEVSDGSDPNTRYADGPFDIALGGLVPELRA